MAKKNKFQKKFERGFAMLVNKVMGSGLSQLENEASGEKYVTPGMPEQVRALAEEGIVLLKNDNDALPFKENDNVAVFGRVQYDWFFVGYGSGGDVHPPYTVSLYEGFENAGIYYNKELKTIYENWCQDPDNQADHGYWGHWPFYYEEMPLDEAIVTDAAKKSNIAMVILGRAAGEDRENKLEEGSYYLTAEEKDMLQKVTKAFSKTVVVMDCGNIIDMSWTDDYDIDALVYAWQLGQENGNALANVLVGKVTPSGKLSDTIAKIYQDYPSASNFGAKEFNNYAEDIYVGYRYFSTFAPDRVKYPFGFGLSYTSFDTVCQNVTANENDFIFTIKVTNTGNYAGKEVVQIYVEAPQGKLGKAKRVLVGYKKTSLLETTASEILEITVNKKDMASYDDSGITGFKDCFLLEAGTYKFYMGTDATTENNIYEFNLDTVDVMEKCHEVMAPEPGTEYKVLNPSGTESIMLGADGKSFPARTITTKTMSLRERILKNLPSEIAQTGDKGIKLTDVKSGKNTLDEFIAQLSDKELGDLTRGEAAMNSPLGVNGNAGAFAGITEELRAKGIPAIITADGPAGLRVRKYTTLLPCGTAIACSWNSELIEKTFQLVGEEVHHFGVDVNLAPGMNIHRNPLCGRNFEYYSEDPMLSGRTAAATTRGLQVGGSSACPKHFACNNQEFNRNSNDSRVSVRALREIYLKNFEYCVKEGHPETMMTSYNKINGVWSHYNYDLVTTVLRKEWGYDGMIVTDWWMQKDNSHEFPALKNNAYRTRAQVDVLMPGNMSAVKRKYAFDKEQIETLGQPEGLTRAELQRSAKNVLRYCMTRSVK